MKRFIATAAAAALALTATAFGASAAGKLKVGFIYLGPDRRLRLDLPA